MEKKSKKSLAVVLLILFIMAGAGACYLYLSQVHTADENKELVLEEGQEYVYAKITSISGNEMDYIVLDARTMDFRNFPKKDGERIGNGFGKNAGGGRRNKTAQAEELITYIETDKTGRIQIPVGVEVETKLGTTTTFSRLSNGDTIKMLLQEDADGNKELIKIWIVK